MPQRFSISFGFESSQFVNSSNVHSNLLVNTTLLIQFYFLLFLHF